MRKVSFLIVACILLFSVCPLGKADKTISDVQANVEDTSESINKTGIGAVSAGLNHTVALNKSGRVVAIGFNDRGQCNVSGLIG